MKNEPSLKELSERIQNLGKELGGVFTFSDLWVLLGLNSSVQTAKAISRLVREGFLTKIRRNIYAGPSPDLWVMASRLKRNASISMDSVLAKNALIGTVPARSVSLIYPGNAQTIETPFGRIRFFKIKKDLLFGTQRLKNGVTVTDNEKAFLDLLYFHQKGARFVVDPRRDVDLWKLDRKKIKNYLKNYKNPKFRKFVEGMFS